MHAVRRSRHPLDQGGTRETRATPDLLAGADYARMRRSDTEQTDASVHQRLASFRFFSLHMLLSQFAWI